MLSSEIRFKIAAGLSVALVVLIHCNSPTRAHGSIGARQLVEPREYVRIHQLACKRNRTLAAIAQQTIERDSIELLVSQERACLREPQAWRWKYYDENEGPKWRALIRERSIDERLANTIYSATGTKMFNIDGFRFDSGDEMEDARNRQLVAGPEVDHERCGSSLRSMLEQMHELSALVSGLRSTGGQNERRLEERHIRLARVLDSFGRYEANHLSGRFMSLGSPSQCQSSQLLLTQPGSGASSPESKHSLVNMRFCWARHKLEQQLDESLRARSRSDFEIQGNFLLSGVCLPESCHSSSFDKFAHLFEQVISSQFKLPTSIYINETLPLDSVFCLVHPSSPIARMPVQGKLLLLALACYLLTCLLVTWRDSRGHSVDGGQAGSHDESSSEHLWSIGQQNHTNRQASVWSALDLVESWRDFTGANASSKQSYRRVPIDLDTLNPIKVIGCAYVVFGHSIVVWLGFMMDEVAAIQSYERDTYLLIMLAGTTMVDTFFVISGMLTAYVSLRKLRKLDHFSPRKQSDDGQSYASLLLQSDESRRASEETTSSQVARSRARVAPSSQQASSGSLEPAKSCDQFGRQHSSTAWLTFMRPWLFFGLVRYLRIVPMFTLVHALKRLVLLYAGDGPMWDYGLNRHTPVGACKRELWWTPLTPVSAWLPLTKSCILQSWSLSNDIFFCLVSPPIILLLRSRPRLAIVLALSLSALSVALGQLALLSVRFGLNYELYQGRGYSFTRIVNEYSFLYTLPVYRVFSLLIGLTAGYLLYKHSQAHESKPSAETRQFASRDENFNGRRKRQMSLAELSQFRQQRQPRDSFDLGLIKQTAAPIQRGERQIFAAWLTGPVTCLSLAIIVGLFWIMVRSQNFKEFIKPHHTIVLPLWLNYTRVLWALANAFLFLRMTTDWRNSWPMRLFASNFWKIYSKLVFAILLVHFDLLAFVHLSSARTINSALGNAFIEAAGVYLLCLPLSVILFVAFENPINKLVNVAILQRIK